MVFSQGGLPMSVTFPEIRVGEPVRHETLSVFPLFAPPSHELDYQFSHEALGTEAVSVKEVSEAGSVGEFNWQQAPAVGEGEE
jgi:hypothetical protein